MESDRKTPTHPRVLFARVSWVKHTPFNKNHGTVLNGASSSCPHCSQGSSSYVTHLFVISPRAYIPHYNTMAILVNARHYSVLAERVCMHFIIWL